LNNQCQEEREGGQDHKVMICVTIVRRKAIGPMNVETKEEVDLDLNEGDDDTQDQDLTKKGDTEKEVDPIEKMDVPTT